MITSLLKCSFLIAVIAIPLANASVLAADKVQQAKPNLTQDKLAKLEASFDGRIGVYAIDTNNGQIIAYRSNERFPIQSTMKMIGVAALLKLGESNKNLLQEK